MERYREYWQTSFARLDGVLSELQAGGKKRQRAAPRRR
jgi:hypothetical protein